jgi:prolipoprotein diacylglyceryltransferase
MDASWLYFLFIPLGAGVYLLWRPWYTKHRGWQEVLPAVILIGTPVAMILSHMAWFFTSGISPSAWQSIFLTLDGWRSGYLSIGLIAGTVLTICIVSAMYRLPSLELLDFYSPAAFVASAVWRLDCFVDGCCYGAPTELPWGVRFRIVDELKIMTEPSHPVQLYEVIVSVAVLFSLPFFLKKFGINPGKGIVLAICAFLYSAERFALDFFRIGGTSRSMVLGMSSMQLISLAMMILVAVVFIAFLRKRRISKSQS